ncbi:alpha/beta fold hydrolase [Alteromonas sp. ASW11-19]|uniref:Alpha/beta fold hydrolase n=1 Tax=Alteromonas salexigens TaxID=2982530 RepID=A0ABT2VJA1_9ALTE|nr:alpha/beta fold hydrolase [Alteromonas salexigens]MCU7553295.1 alpha/beta fold hydrolase [Alteromonas salexigens]
MDWTLTPETALADRNATTINPFWKSQVTTGEFTGLGGVTVHYAWCCPANAHTTVVISSGRIESLLKYKELIYDLWHNGFAVFIPDHRGQGLSGRMTSDPQHGFVHKFDDYVDDLLQFIDDIVMPHAPAPLTLLCHSMGGAIGTLTMLREPERFERAVLASPMFGVRPALPDWVAKGLINAGLTLNRLRRKDAGYFFGQTPYVAYPYALNKLTHSEVRYRLFRELYDEDKRIQLGGVTTEWLSAAQQAMDTIEAQAEKMTTPTLLFSADDDKIIDNDRQRSVAKRMPNLHLEVVAEAYHELFTEADEYRTPVLNKTLSFLQGGSILK